MPPGTSLWHSLLVRHANRLKEVFQRASQAIEGQLSSATASGQPQAQLQTVLVRNTPKHPLHPLARIRQSHSRWFSTARDALNSSVRRNFSSSAACHGAGRPRFDRSSFPKSRISTTIAQSAGRAPFASTLRPNLTGGTLGRTSGGYTLGGGAARRNFSHVPASQAQVVQNVSQGVRAFFLSGQKAQFDGTCPRTGEKRFVAVSSLQHQTGKKLRSVPRATPGSSLRYKINPTITALTPLGALAGISAVSEDDDVQSFSLTTGADHLNTSGLLDALSVDFSRALKDLAAVLSDLKRLSALGDLPITAQGATLQIHFPGCDAETVEKLCEELGVLRGTVVQDEAFDKFVGTEIALLFPFAPSAASDGLSESEDGESLFDYHEPSRNQKVKHRRDDSQLGKHFVRLDDMFSNGNSNSSPEFSTQSDSGLENDADFEDVLGSNPWRSEDEQPFSAYESVSLRSASSPHDRPQSRYNERDDSPLEYQGFEGIYRFLEELDSTRR